MRHLKTRTLRFIEFMVMGLVFGLGEDLVAVWLATGHLVTSPRVIGMLLLVSCVFAFVSEYIVDHPRFWHIVLRMKDEHGKDHTQGTP